MLFIPSTLTQQPQYTVTIAAPYAAITKSAIIASVPYDIVRRVTLAVPDPQSGTGTLTRRNNRHGASLINLLDSYRVAATGEDILPTGNEVTILWQAYKRADASVTAAFGSATVPDGDAVNIFLPYAGDGNVYWRWGGSAGGTGSLNVASLSFAPGDWWAFTAGPRGHEIWQNFRKVGSNAPGSSATRGTPLLGAFWGKHGTAGAGTYCEVEWSMWAVLTKQLDPGFLSSGNYWRIFAPVRNRFYSLSAGGGIAFDAAANSGYQAASSSYTFNRTCTGSNRYLSVDVALLSAGQTVTSVVDDNGGGNVAMTFLGAKSTVTSFGRIECWGLIAPATGTKQIQVNLSGSIASSAEAVSYTGVHQSVATEAFNSAQATNVGAADATVTITPVANNCWIHAAIATDDTAVTANQTTRNNVTGAGGSGANEDTGPISPAAATAMSYTGVGALATWAIAGYALRPVAAAGAVLARIYAFVMG